LEGKVQELEESLQEQLSSMSDMMSTSQSKQTHQDEQIRSI